MNNLSSFLDKFKKLLSKEIEVRDVVVKSVFDRTHISLQPEEISVKGSVIYLPHRPLIQSEIYMKKQLILDDIRTFISSTNFTDIR